MRSKLYYSVFVILLSCSVPDVTEASEVEILPETNKEEISVEHESVILPEIHYQKKDPNVDFEISNCQREDCEYENNLIFDKKLVNGNLKLLMGGWHNCDNNDGVVKQIYYENDTLKLNLFHRKYQMTSDGFMTYESVDCKCYYIFDLVVKNITKMPETIYLGFYKYKEASIDNKKIKEIKSNINK